MLEGWINIFKTGIHTSSNGIKREWKLEDLQQLVDNFNSDDRVPLVVGHPKENSPAFGWISDLKIESGNLFAKFTDLHDGFKEAVKQGLYRNRSVSIGKTENGFKLFHLGWLGGVLPAVEGLDPVKYNSDIELDTYVIPVAQVEFNIQRKTKTSETKEMLLKDDIEEVESPNREQKSEDFAALQKEVMELRNSLAEKDKALSAQDDVKQQLESFSARMKEVESLNSALKKENEGLAIQFAKERHTRVTTEFNIFLEEIERKGVNLPAAKEELIAFSLSLEGHSFKTKDGEKNGMEFMKTMLGSLTPVVELGSMFGKESDFAQPDQDDETTNYVNSIVKMANQKMGVVSNA
jgi:hypothetical protein